MPPRKRTSVRVAIARVVPPELPAGQTFSSALRSALLAGTTTSRYGRLWRVGRISPYRHTLLGKIGYETDESMELWNEAAGDFETKADVIGQTSPFAVHDQTGRIAFQLRTSIGKASFAGALAVLLDSTVEATGLMGWTVEMEERPETFLEFVARVDRVSSIYITMRPPNPNFKNKQRVEHIVGGTKAELAQLHLAGEELDLTDELVAELIDYAANDYGKVSAVGHLGTARLPYDSERRRGGQERYIAADPDTGDADGSALRQEAGEDQA